MLYIVYADIRQFTLISLHAAVCISSVVCSKEKSRTVDDGFLLHCSHDCGTIFSSCYSAVS